MLFVRPESLAFANGEAGENIIESTVVNGEFEGSSFSVFLRGEGGQTIMMSMTNTGFLPKFSPGDAGRLTFSPERAVVLPRGEVADE